MTDQRYSTVERAFQLAREGRCRNIDDIRRALNAEDCQAVDITLFGAAIKRQLTAAIAEARKAADG